MTQTNFSRVAAAAAIAVLFSSAGLFAQETASAAINATATVAAKARLEVVGAIAFADADPETTAVINAAPLDVTVKARTAPSETVTLTVVAGDDLKTAADDVIGINNLTWTATGSGFVAGTSNKAVAQSVGSWTGSGTRNGTQTYRLTNSWAYATGSYSVTLTYTLTAP